MNTYDTIKRNRRLVTFGIWLTAGLAVLVLALRLGNASRIDIHEVAGAVGLGTALALPAAFAAISLDRRPTLLPAAIWGAIVAGVVTISLLPIYLIPAYLWWKAWRTRPVATVSPSWAPFARIGLAGLVLVAAMSLFSYENPHCFDTFADGTTVDTDPGLRGLEGGWKLGIGGSSTSFGDSGVASEDGPAVSETDVVASECESDRIVVAEGLAALAITGATVGLAMRWPHGVTASAARNDDETAGSLS